MKVVTILGSPRRKGNTAAVLAEFERAAAPLCDLERITLADYTYHGCLGCDGCQRKPGVLGCGQKDDAPAILTRLLAADVIVYATPLYAWDFSSQLKLLVDRHYCLVKWKDGASTSLMAGKRAALLVTCGGEIENNADVVQVIFQREMDYIRCQVIGQYIVPNCTTPKALGGEAKRVGLRMAREILGAAPGPRDARPA